MDLHDIGKILKTEREKKGYSIEDVYKETKISIMNIEAIEKGEFDMLPHPIYTRAFIKTYAEFLSLDTDKILEVYDSIYNPPKLSKLEEGTKDITASKSKWIWILILLFFVFVAFCIYFFKMHRTKKIDVINNISSNIENNDQVKNSNNLSKNSSSFLIDRNDINKTEDREDLNSSSAELKEQNINATNTTLNIAKSNNATKTESVLNSTSNSSVISTSVKTKEHVVKIVAKDTCWLRGKYDGNHTREALLSKGDVIVFKFRDNLEVKVGNLGGIDVVFDGKDMSFNGKRGQVKTLRFP